MPLAPGGNNGCGGVPGRRRRKYNTTALTATATDSATAARGYGPNDQSVTNSLALLEAIEAGDRVAEHIAALVASVLEAPAVKLARAAQEPGPFRVRRALDLAELVLTAAGLVDADARSTG